MKRSMTTGLLPALACVAVAGCTPEYDLGIYYDSTSKLWWQNEPPGSYFTWDEAKSYCNGLSYLGHADWRLPTISELRSLVRGCAATETGGSCGVTDECLTTSCQDASCDECTSGGGPASGCYWPDAGLGGTCSWYWSSSSVAGASGFAWYVYFDFGLVHRIGVLYDCYARCVRGGP